jgi:hypothetical protein
VSKVLARIGELTADAMFAVKAVWWIMIRPGLVGVAILACVCGAQLGPSEAA